MRSLRCLLLALLGLATLSGCATLVFVSDRDGGTKQIFRMRATGQNQTNLFGDTTFPDSFPDVSRDGKMIVYISTRPDGARIVIRDTGDAAGSTETVIWETNARKVWPRWSCQQDLIAFAEYFSDQARIFAIRAAPGNSPLAVTSPGPDQSDGAGHDLFDNGNKIVFSRSNSTGGTYDLYFQSSDGTGTAVPITSTGMLNEVLPVVSLSGALLAYLSYIPLASGWVEVINIVGVGPWTPLSQITLQPPLGGRRIDALAFSDDEQRLYVSTKSADVPASEESGKHEIFSVKLDGSQVRRLTNNVSFDSFPSAIPKLPGPPCTRCVDIAGMPPVSPTQQVVRNGVVFKAATLPSGNPASIRVSDYCPSGDGVVELVIPWSQTDAELAEYATINFPSALFGDGPSEVTISGCHYFSDRFRLSAFDKNGSLVSAAEHTAGQGVTQTLILHGAGISRIEIIGAEIGFSNICYRR